MAEPYAWQAVGGTIWTSEDNRPYTKPEWQGLTEEERDAITDSVIGFNSCCGWEDDYAKAIEAKLKEKNGG
jgi:hypothetical protein